VTGDTRQAALGLSEETRQTIAALQRLTARLEAFTDQLLRSLQQAHDLDEQEDP
jgi:hypothetical protein